MESKILSKRALPIVVLSGFALSLAFIFYLIPKGSVQGVSALPIENSVAPPEQRQVCLPAVQPGFGLPLRLKIPTINVDAAIKNVGLTSNGSMDITESQDDVAWYKLGPRPGENGSAVIAGHFGLRNQKGSVFDNLHKLHPKDKIYIEDDKGTIISFVVRESKSYDPQADAPAVFGSNDGQPHLNLVTCEGVWDEASKTFSKRLVVFTDKE